MLRRRLLIWCDHGIVLLLLLAGLLCVLPAVYMIVGVLLHLASASPEGPLAAFSDLPRLGALLANSLRVTGMSVAISLLLGVPVGLLTFRTDLPFRRIIIVGAMLAACLPLYVVAACWMAVFGQRFWLYSPAGAGWIMGIAYAPLAALTSGVCFAGIDPALEEQGLLDADRWTVFLRVTLPLGLWGVAASALVVVVFSMTLIDVTDILMVRTFAEETFTQFQLSNEPWRAAATSLPVIALVYLLAVCTLLLLRRHGESTLAHAGARPLTFPLRRCRVPAALGVLIVAFALFGLPIGFLGRAASSFSAFAHSYRAASPELWGSLRLAAFGATVSASLAIPAAWALHRHRAIGTLAAGALILLIATPAPVVGVGIAQVLSRGSFLYAIYNSQIVVVLAYIVRIVPFAVLAALPVVRQVPLEVEECASIDGCTWLQKMAYIILPMSWRGALFAWLLSLVLSLAEIGASVIVVPPGRTTLTIRFFTLIHYGLYPDAAGICLILLFVIILPAALIALLLWRILRERFC